MYLISHFGGTNNILADCIKVNHNKRVYFDFMFRKYLLGSMEINVSMIFNKIKPLEIGHFPQVYTRSSYFPGGTRNIISTHLRMWKCHSR